MAAANATGWARQRSAGGGGGEILFEALEIIGERFEGLDAGCGKLAEHLDGKEADVGAGIDDDLRPPAGGGSIKAARQIDAAIPAFQDDIEKSAGGRVLDSAPVAENRDGGFGRAAQRPHEILAIFECATQPIVAPAVAHATSHIGDGDHTPAVLSPERRSAGAIAATFGRLREAVDLVVWGPAHGAMPTMRL